MNWKYKNSEEYRIGYQDGIKSEIEHRKRNGSFFERIHDLILEDISRIYFEQGGQDGMYPLWGEDAFKLGVKQNGFGTVERILRNKVKGYENYPVRVYVLNCNCGGICILGYKDGYHQEITYTMFHLGEDDGFFFVHDDGGAGADYMNKTDLIDMVSRAISLLNNNK